MLVYDGSWWNVALSYGLFASLGWFGQSVDFGKSIGDILPIQEVLPSDLLRSDIADYLLISGSDIAKFKEYCMREFDLGKKVYLFRFSLTDYVAEDLTIYFQDESSGLNLGSHWDNQAYLAQENVYFDFDIIQLTFNRDGVYTVIPAVSDPIDIFADVESPLHVTNTSSYWFIFVILAIAVLVSVVVMIWLK
jgi:hypothetical protein